MNEDIRSKTFGILIHNLPLEFSEEAVKLFSEKYVSRVILDRQTGLQVYFNKYEYAREIIIKQKIQIKGIPYTVYPLVTNITIYNIRYYEFKSEILKLLSYYGRIIDKYPIKDSSEKFTNDYRIILDVPEVLADFNLPYILHLPSDTRHSFRVEFFCRLCRKNGHKQYECPQHFPPSRKEKRCFRKCYETEDTFESNDEDKHLSHNSRNLRQNRNELSGCSKDVRSSKRRITRGKETSSFSATDDSPSSEIQQMVCGDTRFKEDECYAGYRRCPKQEDKNKKEKLKNGETESLPNYLSTEMLRSIVNAVQAQKQDEHSVIQIDDPNHLQERVTFDMTIMHKNTHHESVDTKYMHSDQNKGCSIKEEKTCEWRSIEEVVPNNSIPNNTVRRKSINNCLKTKGSTSRRRKSSPLVKMRPVLTELSETLLKHASDTAPKDISPSVEQKLRHLLKYLRSVENISGELRNRRDFLDRYLERVVRERRIHQRRTAVKPKDRQQTQPSRNQLPGPSSRTRKRELSEGIKNVILKVRGVLPPPKLCNFLNQTRCRRKKLEMARHFTANISALVLQLLDVVKAYYVQGDRGVAEDIDINYIKRIADVLKTGDSGKEATAVVKLEPMIES